MIVRVLTLDRTREDHLRPPIGPNPSRRMFMAERGIELPHVEVDIRTGASILSIFPASARRWNSTMARSCRITAICEYLDEKYPGPSLIGSTPEQRGGRACGHGASINILELMANGFRFSDGQRCSRIVCTSHTPTI